jgi:hypothetical protein
VLVKKFGEDFSQGAACENGRYLPFDQATAATTDRGLSTIRRCRRHADFGLDNHIDRFDNPGTLRLPESGK